MLFVRNMTTTITLTKSASQDFGYYSK